ncbi:hypothetical protein [Micromonospora sp. 4G55]|uniref:hypothetical protein n=1 Tax=Micromonospora sp. 4G55 TaxID=2806102 RepID=UPI001A58ECB7|nr:hypothetical protein [Micromonospora sp. 4G55]MBM0260088.1 hypothetical protein [Micromonospora sp. 4G55]
MAHTSRIVATETARSVPQWSDVAAWATVWCTVPSSAWRVAAGLGVDVGFTGELGDMYRGPAFLLYVWVLTVVSQAGAFLTLGLVRPWGERVPSWIPRLGGRPIPPLAVITPALLGGVAVTALCAMVALAPNGPLDNPDFPRGAAGVIMALCYAPLLAWGPLVIALTVSYARRRGVVGASRDPHAGAMKAPTP